RLAKQAVALLIVGTSGRKLSCTVSHPSQEIQCPPHCIALEVAAGLLVSAVDAQTLLQERLGLRVISLAECERCEALQLAGILLQLSLLTTERPAFLEVAARRGVVRLLHARQTCQADDVRSLFERQIGTLFREMLQISQRPTKAMAQVPVGDQPPGQAQPFLPPLPALQAQIEGRVQFIIPPSQPIQPHPLLPAEELRLRLLDQAQEEGEMTPPYAGLFPR